MRVGALCLWAALALGPVCACGASDEAADGTISGTVTDTTTGRAIRGASVRFVSDTLDEQSAETNASGRYQLVVVSDTPQGHIEAQKSGYRSRTVSVYLDEPTLQVDIELAPD